MQGAFARLLSDCCLGLWSLVAGVAAGCRCMVPLGRCCRVLLQVVAGAVARCCCRNVVRFGTWLQVSLQVAIGTSAAYALAVRVLCPL